MRAERRRVGDFERILHVRRVPVLGSLPGPDLAVVAEYARERFFRAGESVLRQGEPIGGVYVIVEGELRVRRGERDFGVAGPGSGVGGLAILAREAQGVEVTAAEDTLTLELDADAVSEMLEDNFQIFRHVLRATCRWAIELWCADPGRITVIPFWKTAPTGAQRDLDLVDRIVFFRQTPFFARGSINALAELSRGLVEMHFEPGAVLWREGEASRNVFMVVAGELACASAPRGIRFRVLPGAGIGTLEAIAGRPRWFDALAEQPVTVLGGDIEGLLDVMEDNFEMASDYLTALARNYLHHAESVADADSYLRAFYGVAEGSALANR